jgi:hypothetical protein
LKKLNGFWLLILTFLLIFSLNISSVKAEQSYKIDNYLIEMDINNEGDFIITEEIEYNFLKGEFSTAYREIPGRGFSSLDFISITGVGTPVLDYNVSDGAELEIDWEYPPNSNQATFRIEYLGKAALISRDGRNIVDWQAVGTDWNVAIANTELKLNLPERPTDIQFKNDTQPVRSSGRNLYFQKKNIEAGEGWRLTFDFREQIAMPEKTSLADYFSWLIVLMIIALLILIYRIFNSYRIMNTAAKNSELKAEELTQFNDLNFTEKLLLYDYSAAKGPRMLAGLVFYLAKINLVKLKVEVKDKFFGGEKAILKVSAADNLTEKDKVEDLARYSPLFDELKGENKKLQKVISKSSIWKKIISNFKNGELLKNWESDYRKDLRKKSLFTALLLILFSIGFFLDFVISERIITFLPSVFTGILAVGEFIRYAVIVPLTDPALKMREKIDKELAQRRDRLEELVETDSLAALELILNNLGWFLVDSKMSGSKFKKYRKKIENNLSKKEAEKVELPDWLAVDGLEGALEAIEIVEYTMTAVYAAVASTSATAAGSAGAGGGGGGAA